MSASVRLRELLGRDRVAVAADVHDGLSVRLADLHGFETLMLTGSAAAATLAGAPDGGVPLEDVVELGGRLEGLPPRRWWSTSTTSAESRTPPPGCASACRGRG